MSREMSRCDWVKSAIHGLGCSAADHTIMLDDDGESVEHEFEQSMAQRLTRKATMADVSRGYNAEEDMKDPMELEETIWERLNSCHQFYVYCQLDPESPDFSKHDEREAGWSTYNHVNSPSAVRLCLSCPSVEIEPSLEDSHWCSRALHRLRYWLSPCSIAFIESKSIVPVATALEEALYYTKLATVYALHLLNHIKSKDSSTVLTEPPHDIASSRTLMCCAISLIANIVGAPPVSGVGLQNAGTMVRSIVFGVFFAGYTRIGRSGN